MAWQRLGLLPIAYEPGTWRHSHASIPTPVLIGDKFLRVYFNCRDSSGISYVSYGDFYQESGGLLGLQSIAESPCLAPGEPGTFDDNGVLQCCVTKSESGEFVLYYAGFELGTKIRYRLFTGAAISHDGGLKFHRYSEAPILDRCDGELHFRGGPFVKKTNNGFEMTYVSGNDWVDTQYGKKPVYTLAGIESSDGFTFHGAGRHIDFPLLEGEFSLGRPWYCTDGPCGKGLYVSIRSLDKVYSLAYASIANNGELIRDDSQFSGLLCGNLPEGEQEMQCYASLIAFNGTWYLFYNGNDFGREGITYAKWVD